MLQEISLLLLLDFSVVVLMPNVILLELHPLLVVHLQKYCIENFNDALFECNNHNTNHVISMTVIIQIFK